MNTIFCKTEFDAVGRRLVHAAEICQSQQHFLYEEKHDGGNMHPIRALFIASNGRKDRIYKDAITRLFDCCGSDFLDHSQEENIDDLIAAAYWS